jgi:hypothetical protein
VAVQAPRDDYASQALASRGLFVCRQSEHIVLFVRKSRVIQISGAEWRSTIKHLRGVGIILREVQATRVDHHKKARNSRPAQTEVGCAGGVS